MICSNQVVRFLHSSRSCWNAVDKSLLGKLRKQTGYTFSNCRKALELHDNDVEKVITATRMKIRVVTTEMQGAEEVEKYFEKCVLS